MPAIATWPDIALRLACALAAGLLIGLNRSEHGRAAGLRTMTLVSLAACISMVQVNLLLPLSGKAPDSFIVMDLMRLPLGILSGMGFIGAGAIFRRDDFVTGVTTAAGMWFVTVIGLCFGGGQIWLGAAGTAVGIAVLSVLKTLEDRIKRDHSALLVIVTGAEGPSEDEFRADLQADGFRIKSMGSTSSARSRKLHCWLEWRAYPLTSRIPDAVHRLAARA